MITSFASFHDALIAFHDLIAEATHRAVGHDAAAVHDAEAVGNYRVHQGIVEPAACISQCVCMALSRCDFRKCLNPGSSSSKSCLVWHLRCMQAFTSLRGTQSGAGGFWSLEAWCVKERTGNRVRRE